MKTDFKVIGKISSENFHIFNVEKWKKLTPEGKEGTYIKMEVPDWVGAVVFDESTGKFVCVREYRHGVEKTVTQFPCGTVESGENKDDAVVRELCEELGIEKKDIKKIRQIYTGCPNPAFMNNSMSFYFVTLEAFNQKAQKLDDSEFINVMELSAAEVDGFLGEPDGPLMMKYAWEILRKDFLEK